MNKKISLDSAIKIIEGEVIEIRGKRDSWFAEISPLAAAGEKSLCFCSVAGAAAEESLKKTKAAIVLCPRGVILSERSETTYLVVDNPRLCAAKLLKAFFVEPAKFGIHPSAIIGRKCRLGRISIAPYVVIDAGVEIGDGSVILAGAVIAEDAKIGKNTLIKSNAVVGQKGFGFEIDKNGKPFVIPHVGGVVVGSNVEIGANCVICRGTLANTVISNDVKIDDQVFVAHNVFVGPRTMIAAAAEISGSAKIGADCWIGPNCTVRDGISIGDNVLVGMGAVVAGSVPAGVVVAGNPARILRKNRRQSP